MKIAVFLTSFCAVLSANAQPLSITDFLATAKQDNSVMLDEKQVGYLKSTDHELPWVDELEFRTETNDFQLNQQEYRFRLRPNSPRQRKAQRSFHQANIVLNELDRQVSLKEALRERYELVVTHFFVDAVLEASLQLKTLYADQITVFQNMVDDGGFDISDLVKAEDDYHEISLEELRLQHQAQSCLQRIEELSVHFDATGFERGDLADMEVLLQRVNSGAQEESAHVLLTRARTKVDVAIGEYEVEKSSSDNLFDHVQAKYGGRRNDIFSEAFSLGIGILLPFKGDSKLDLNELELDRIVEENKLEKLELQLAGQMKVQTNYIQQLFDEYQLVNDQLQNGQAQYVYERLSNTPGTDPLVLLSTKEVLLKKELALKKLEHKIYLAYIDWLDISGKMEARPLRNYLSVELKTF